jgi:hypothetical protein
MFICNNVREARNADVPGQPQCRRKDIIIGFPSLSGTGSLEDEGALESISGTGDICRAGGLFHELNSWKRVMVFMWHLREF